MDTEADNKTRIKSRRTIRWGRKALVGALLIAAMLVLAVTVRGISSWWNMGQARNYCEEAKRLLDNGQTDEGLTLLIQAWRMAPKDAGIMRELAQRLDELPNRASDAVNVWRDVANLPSATADDKVSLTAALVKTASAPAARQILEKLPADVRQRPGCLEIEADLLMIEGRAQESEILLRSALEKSPNDPKARFRLAKLQMNSLFPEIREEARRTLWELSRSGGKVASKALLALSTQPFSGSEIIDARAIMASNSGISSADRLAILTACAKQQPALADELITEESRRVAGKRPEDCTEFYTWLSDMGQADKILKDLSEHGVAQAGDSSEAGTTASVTIEPKDAVLSSRELFLAFGDALIMKKDWNSFSTLLTQPSLPVEKEEVALMNAISADGTGEPAEVVDRHLAVALAYAQNKMDLSLLIRVADQSERLERPRLALQALMSLLPSNQIMRLDVLQRSYRLQKALRLSEDMLTTADAILETQPKLMPYVDEAAYLRLLIGRDFERELDRFSPGKKDVIMEASPLSRLAWSLSAYYSGSMDAAGKWLAGMDGTGLSAGQRAVFAGLLKATGRAAEAFRIAEKIFPDSILPEEKWFLEQALN